MANKTHKQMLNIANIREMEIKTTMRYHLILIRIAIKNRKEQMLVRI